MQDGYREDRVILAHGAAQDRGVTTLLDDLVRRTTSRLGGGGGTVALLGGDDTLLRRAIGTHSVHDMLVGRRIGVAAIGATRRERRRACRRGGSERIGIDQLPDGLNRLARRRHLLMVVAQTWPSAIALFSASRAASTASRRRLRARQSASQSRAP